MIRPWIAFFSQTGSEIANLSEQLGRWPDVIVVNERKVERVIDSRLQNKKVVFVTNRPSESELINILQWFENPIVTLHGWLRIMPPEICETYEIYNGHPGLITTYPELKGKDPQEKYWENIDKFDSFGSVIHVVNEGVDEGNIVAKYAVDKSFMNIETKDDVYRALRTTSLNCWTQFFTMDGENSII